MIENSGTGQITVVMPTYGHAQYIRQALDSLLSQTRPAACIIVINDGSPDDTDGQVAPYLDRITYLQQLHQGLGSAVGRGLDLVETEYVQFMASDDWMAPNAFAVLARLLDDDPRLGVAHGGRIVVEGPSLRGSIPSRLGKYPIIEHAFDSTMVFSHPSILWRTQAVNRDRRFRRFSLSLDWAHWIESGVGGWYGYAVSDRLGFYRRHATNTSLYQAPILMETQRMLRFVRHSYAHVLGPADQIAIQDTLAIHSVQSAWLDLERGLPRLARRRFRRVGWRGEQRWTVLFGEVVCTLPPPGRRWALTMRARWNRRRRQRQLAEYLIS
jgi:glycosyltransferase involved in cell wall biosynthesis